MKILALPDLHLTDKTPENRVDNYPETQEAKMDQIFRIAHEEEIDIVCQSGDLFDSDKASDYLKQKWIPYIKNRFTENEWLVVFGQHDLRYHSRNKKNTPLRVLESAKTLTILGSEPYMYENYDFYGCSWGEEIPKIHNEDAVNILVIHKMFVMDKKAWQSQKLKEDELANTFMKTHPFDIVISGDNHQHFCWSDGKGRFHINCGSLMRNRIDQVNHKPSVYVIDTKERTAKRILLDVAPFEEVMDMEEAKNEKEKDKKLKAFIDKLPDNIEIKGLKFEENLSDEVEELKALKDEEVFDEGVEDMINEIMEACI